MCLLVFASCAAQTQKMPVREKPVRPETREALHAALNQARLKVGHIGRHDWAGQYCFSGVSLVLTPDGDAVYTLSCDVGMADWDIGHIVEVRPDRILIEWGDPSQWRSKVMADVLFRVRWGGRHYLIPEHRMIEFCNDVNSGFEADMSMRDSVGCPMKHLLRDVDWIARAEGVPGVPPAYKKYILKQPITAEITRVISREPDSEDWQIYMVEVNAGADAGLLPQMTLVSQSDFEFCGVFEEEVISVDRKTSRVRIRLAHGCDECVPRVGDTLSTRNRWFDVEQKTASVQAD